MERRKRDRSDLRLPCYVEWPTLGGYRTIGVSENISRNGMLLRLEDAVIPADSLKVGRTTIVEVELPAEHSMEPRCMHCEGKIVRIGLREDKIQVALRFQNLEFRDRDGRDKKNKIDLKSNYVM